MSHHGFPLWSAAAGAAISDAKLLQNARVCRPGRTKSVPRQSRKMLRMLIFTVSS